jgi:hypothetical protein
LQKIPIFSKTPIFAKSNFLEKTPIFAKTPVFKYFFAKNANFCKKCQFLQKRQFLSIFHKKRRFSQKRQFMQKTPIFAKNANFCKKTPIFAKNANFCKVKYFSKNRKAAEKFAKIGKKVFLRSPIFAKGFGEFWGNLIGFLQKSCFLTQKPIFAKKIANIFAMSATISPWGKGFESCSLGKSEICRIFCWVCKITHNKRKIVDL